MSFWESMKRYPSKAIKSRVSLNSLHKNCSCVQTDCKKKKTVVLILPPDSECLYCDLCAVFAGRKSPDAKRMPDYMIYLTTEGYKPQWVVVETKNPVKDDYAVSQMQQGLKRMTDMREMFAVRPRPEVLLGLLVHGRRRVRISEKVLMSRKYMLKYGGLKGFVRECNYGTSLEKYMKPR